MHTHKDISYRPYSYKAASDDTQRFTVERQIGLKVKEK